jgi:hypothetical protein
MDWDRGAVSGAKSIAGSMGLSDRSDIHRSEAPRAQAGTTHSRGHLKKSTVDLANPCTAVHDCLIEPRGSTMLRCLVSCLESTSCSVGLE